METSARDRQQGGCSGLQGLLVDFFAAAWRRDTGSGLMAALLWLGVDVAWPLPESAETEMVVHV